MCGLLLMINTYICTYIPIYTSYLLLLYIQGAFKTASTPAEPAPVASSWMRHCAACPCVFPLGPPLCPHAGSAPVSSRWVRLVSSPGFAPVSSRWARPCVLPLGSPLCPPAGSAPVSSRWVRPVSSRWVRPCGLPLDAPLRLTCDPVGC